MIVLFAHFDAVMKGDKIDLVASLSNIYNTSEDELKKTLEKTNHLITEILKLKPCSASELKPKNLEDIDTGLSITCMAFLNSCYHAVIEVLCAVI